METEPHKNDLNNLNNGGNVTNKSPVSVNFNSKWSKEQLECIRAAEKGQNLFITGPGGVGKTQVVVEIINLLRNEHEKVVEVVAYTAIVAANLGGTTLHYLVKSGKDIESVITMAHKLEKMKDQLEKLLSIDVLVIDEISMMVPQFFSTVNRLFQVLKKNSNPFGGIQLIIVGDFAQLPPIDTTKPRGQEPSLECERLEFSFELDDWKQMNLKVIELKQIFRQKDTSLIQSLNRMRLGDETPNDISLFKSRLNAILEKEGEIIATKLYATNMDVNKFNLECLQNLSGQTFMYYHEFSLSLEKGVKRNRDVEKWTEKHQNYFLEKSGVQLEVALKVGAQVVLLVNIDPERELVNGARGVIVDFEKETGHNFPRVKFTNGKIYTIQTHKRKIACERGIGDINFHQIPLKLAWCLTVHRCQGMTLNLCKISTKGIFEPGQAYVAFSRISSLEDMSLIDFYPKCIKAHPKVVYFYKNGYKPFKTIAYAPDMSTPIIQPNLKPSFKSDKNDNFHTPHNNNNNALSNKKQKFATDEHKREEEDEERKKQEEKEKDEYIRKMVIARCSQLGKRNPVQTDIRNMLAPKPTNPPKKFN